MRLLRVELRRFRARRAVAVVLLVPTVSGLARLAVAAVALLSAVRFGATGVYELTGTTSWAQAAGWIGLVLVTVSVYTAAAFELRSGLGRELLPIGRLRAGPV